MMSVENATNHGINSPVSPSWIYRTDDECRDGVPRFFTNCSVHAAHGSAIGHGGDRGSLVYSVGTVLDGDINTYNLLSRLGEPPFAFKVYPVSISQNEMAFIRALFYSDYTASNTTGDECGLCRRIPYLVLPLAIVTIDGVDRGILMKQHEFSLKQFLFATKTFAGIPQISIDDQDEEQSATSLRSKPTFEPIRSIEVVSAVAFQLFFATTALHEELPHEVDGVGCCGFAHNDIHLGNILLDRAHGRVALCDFELVSPLPRHQERLPTPQLHRLPPYSRQSPHGLFSRTADTWALGLALLSLLTGVDPLFDEARVTNDFGAGPLLQSHAEADNFVPVLDWEANISEHITRLLTHDDPSGRRLAEAEPILHLCRLCLVNRAEAEPATAASLLEQPIFDIFRENPRHAEFIVRNWAASRMGCPY